MNGIDYEKFLDKKVNVIIEKTEGVELFLYGFVSEVNDEFLVLTHPKFGITKCHLKSIIRIRKLKKSIIRYNILFINKLEHFKIFTALFCGWITLIYYSFSV